jgi:predicted nuclease with TOPRIM domain
MVTEVLAEINGTVEGEKTPSKTKQVPAAEIHIRTNEAVEREKTKVVETRLGADVYCPSFTPWEQMEEDTVEQLQGQIASYEAMLRILGEDRHTLDERCKKAELEKDVLQDMYEGRGQDLETLAKNCAEIEDKLNSCMARLAAVEAEKQVLFAQCEDQGKCVICLDGFADHVVIPCGHLALCKDCHVGGTRQCPVCRQPVPSVHQVYRP